MSQPVNQSISATVSQCSSNQLETRPPKSHGGLTTTTLGVRITFRLLGYALADCGAAEANLLLPADWATLRADLPRALCGAVGANLLETPTASSLEGLAVAGLLGAHGLENCPATTANP